MATAASGMPAFLDGLLRGRRENMESLTPGRAFVALVLFGGLYGAVMGSFGVDGPRLLQMVYSTVKVPLLVAVTGALCLPTYLVVGTLLGLREDFAQSLRALFATQVVLAVLLASFAPFTLLWYASSSDYSGALLFNGLMFGLASLCAQRVLSRLFEPLVAKEPRHRVMIRLWLVTYAFVGMQMGWVLRPFLGNPGEPTTLFRQEAWGNAYEAVFRHVANLFR